MIKLKQYQEFTLKVLRQYLEFARYNGPKGGNLRKSAENYPYKMKKELLSKKLYKSFHNWKN